MTSTLNMMASMAQPFAGQPGMMGPGGVAHGGQPMVHGHPSSQGMQPGVSMGQQIHPGVAVPGGPQVSQAGPLMAGIIPGGGPPVASGPGSNAHALSHLNPHGGPVIAQQGQIQASQSHIHLVKPKPK